MRCDGCIFWTWHNFQCKTEDYDSDPDVQVGVCNRFPPVFVERIEEYSFEDPSPHFWARPETYGEDWCGEWIAKPKE